jgi:hypothetical protein
MEEYIICTGKYADNFVLLAKKQMVLLGMIDRLIEIGRCYRMKINLKKLVQCCIWSIPLYDSESETLQKVDQKYLESSEM